MTEYAWDASNQHYGDVRVQASWDSSMHKNHVGKTRLLCETSLKKWKSKMPNEAFVRDFPQNLKVEDVL